MFKKEKKNEQQKEGQEQTTMTQKEQTAITQADKIKRETNIIAGKYDNILDGYTPEEISQITGTTGTENMQSSRRIPMITWNLDMRDEDGNDIRPDMFYNCMTGETCKKLSIALLMADGRFREKAMYDEYTRQKTVYCKTTDGEIGIEQSTGNLRDCETCPDKKSKKGERKACTPVINIIAYDLERNQPVVIRAMRSSYVPFSNYLEKHHFKQLLVNGKRIDLPLYMLWMELTLKEESGHGKRYYVANPKCMGPIAEKQTVLALREMSEKLKNLNIVEADDNPNLKYGQREETKNETNTDGDDIPF